MTKKIQTQAELIHNECIRGQYFRIKLQVPEIAKIGQPGQFIHIQIPDLEHRILRRPFSISDIDLEQGSLTLVYKVIGVGTDRLRSLTPGASLNIVGPLGKGFSTPPSGQPGILVAGGYGCAAVFLLARRSPSPPLILMGGRSEVDIILEEEFRELGCQVQIATDDGSAGFHGNVSELLIKVLPEYPQAWIAACGPTPMLKAVSKISAKNSLSAELSLDRVICCGVGACYACVIKRKADTPDGWEYARACLDGPVFRAEDIQWD